MDDRERAMSLIQTMIVRAIKQKDTKKVIELRDSLKNIAICDCGAYFTSNPLHHSDWCESQKKNKFLHEYECHIKDCIRNNPFK